MSDDDHEKLWLNLDFFLEAEGFSQWTYKLDAYLRSPGSSNVLPNGYLFACQHRLADRNGSLKSLREFQYLVCHPLCSAHAQEIDLLQNPLIRALRTHEGQDVIMRVVAVGDNGRKHLDILRVLATAPQVLISANHALPMIREVQLGHITFGVFPLVGYTLDASWANDSVGDILDMLLQALEVGSLYEQIMLLLMQLTFSLGPFIHPQSRNCPSRKYSKLPTNSQIVNCTLEGCLQK